MDSVQRLKSWQPFLHKIASELASFSVELNHKNVVVQEEFSDLIGSSGGAGCLLIDFGERQGRCIYIDRAFFGSVDDCPAQGSPVFQAAIRESDSLVRYLRDPRARIPLYFLMLRRLRHSAAFPGILRF